MLSTTSPSALDAEAAEQVAAQLDAGVLELPASLCEALQGIIDGGSIPHHMADSHRRLALADLLAYKTQRDAASQVALAEIHQLADDTGVELTADTVRSRTPTINPRIDAAHLATRVERVLIENKST